MKLTHLALASGLILTACSSDTQTSAADSKADVKAENVASTELCTDMGPQTPRDISNLVGSNPMMFTMAPASTEMNLCNIHTHTNAEHKGPGFSVFVNDSDSGGYACNDAGSLSDLELLDPYEGQGAYKGVKPGDTIEVHWVHTSCDIEPGEGLGSCLSDTCESNTGTPVVFRGSTTGPSYDQSTCSPLNVTWSVRPNCARVDIGSLHRWAEKGNAFNETKSHGVRQLVTAPELLSPIQ